jgi:hypothetical protein
VLPSHWCQLPDRTRFYFPVLLLWKTSFLFICNNSTGSFTITFPCMFAWYPELLHPLHLFGWSWGLN